MCVRRYILDTAINLVGMQKAIYKLSGGNVEKVIFESVKYIYKLGRRDVNDN